MMKIAGLTPLTAALKKRVRDPKWWRSQLITIGLVLIAWTAISFYQQRHMLAGTAPELRGEWVNSAAQAPAHQARMIYFWGSWCGICSLTSPAVDDIARDYPDQVATVALSSGDRIAVQQYLTEKQYQFATVNDPQGQISRHWGVRVTPSIFYLNPAGEITLVSTGINSEWGMRLRLWLVQYL